jgi:hypothetical protein
MWPEYPGKRGIKPVLFPPFSRAAEFGVSHGPVARPWPSGRKRPAANDVSIALQERAILQHLQE